MDTEALIVHTTVTLDKGQGHPNWYKNAKLGGLYHHTKFKRNWFVNVWVQANINFIFKSK